MPYWLKRWLTGEEPDASSWNPEEVLRVDWARVVPFVGLQLACVSVLWVGWSPVALMVATGLYLLRMFAITAFYHRYFAHRTFKANRAWQFFFGLLGTTAMQRGPLWWAAHHRRHHRFSDTKEDLHSPDKGFWWSHALWFMSRAGFQTHTDDIKDFARYPELRLLNRFDFIAPIALAVGLYFLGDALATHAPRLGTSGSQMLVWGFFISTTVLFHATFTINSLAHRFGSRRYATRDDSRNNWTLALLTLGEGWHNNHHHFPGSARQGFFWWEVDLTWYGLLLLEQLGIIRDLKGVPEGMRGARLVAETG